ncbi:ABC-F family ATP-binding cassette domain-containing protein [Georgenia sp. Z1491]|uniref:ABC-F family ATP-binding cassette domain-containing protein n=1 Tax=Georgenia sp. Z1491 TaxID=3416707 RepID=UPI003CEB2974
MSATLRALGLRASRGPRELFADLDLTVSPGDVWGLAGANGAGKSTLLAILAAAGTGASRSPARPDGAPRFSTDGGPGSPADGAPGFPADGAPGFPADSAPGTPADSAPGTPADGGPEVSGQVLLAPPTASVGLLTQEPDRRPGETLAGMIGRRTGVAPAEAEMNAAATALAAPEPGRGAEDRYAAALDRWLALGGADLAERTQEVVSRLGLGADVDSAMTTLSGGEAARASLAVLLLQRYDVLLLDEPTNDLDLAGLEQLEQFVVGARQGIVVVSHDREFLARTTTGIVEIDAAQHQVTVYDGGYDSYLAERALARRRAREAHDEYAGRVADLRARHQQQKVWTSTGIRNARKKATDGDKHIIHAARARTEKLASKISQTERAIERLEEVPEPRKEWELRMSVAEAPRSGTVVATLDDARVTLGAPPSGPTAPVTSSPADGDTPPDPADANANANANGHTPTAPPPHGTFTLGPITAQISWGDRVVLTGANGSGKTTLLAMLLGRIAPEQGRASLGSGVVVGEVDQARDTFAVNEPLTRVFTDASGLDPEASRTLLAKFALAGDRATRPAASLSPGERTRAALALLQARGVNLLVLDEPTNHLDLPAVEQLEQAVDSFGGTVLLVTHDRRMLAGVRATRRWRMDAGRLTEER